MDQRFFNVPFASAGDRVTVPTAADPGGLVSYTDGYGPKYSLNLATDPLAEAITRTNWNSLFHDVTQAVGAIQKLGAPEWITAANNGGVAFPYEVGALVAYRALPADPWVIYESLVASNIAVPGTDPTKWSVVSGIRTYVDAFIAALANQVNPTQGADLTGYKNRTVRVVLSEYIRIGDYKTGANTWTDAMLAAAAEGQNKIILLDTLDSYAFVGNIPLPTPCVVRGGGKGLTTVTFTGMGGHAGLDGFTFPEGSSRLYESGVQDLTVNIDGANGRYAISTPRGNSVFNINRPTWNFSNLVFKGGPMSGDVAKQDLYTYGWQEYIHLGDGVGHVVDNCEFYGQYDFTLDPAGQNVTASAINLSCVQNLGGMLQPRLTNLLSIHVPIGLEIGWRVSQPFLDCFQFHRCWIGINSPNASLGGNNYSTLEGMYSNGNINAQRNGIVFAASALNNYHNIRVSRAAGGFDHAAGWTGWVLDSVTQYAISGDCRSSNLGVYTATHNGYRFTNCTDSTSLGLFAENCTDGIIVESPTGLKFFTPIFDTVTNAFRISGTLTDSAVFYPRFDTVTNEFVWVGTPNRSGFRIYRNDRGILGDVDVSITGVNTTATTNLRQRTDNNVKRFQGNAGTYTHTFHLEANDALPGDQFTICLQIQGTSAGTFNVTNGGGAGGTLWTVVGLNDAVVRLYEFRAYWNGANWIKQAAVLSL